MSKDCIGFFINPWIFVEARLSHPLLWADAWEFSYYSVLFQESRPTHLQFTLLHSQGEYSELCLHVYIEGMRRVPEETMSYAWIRSGMPEDMTPSLYATTMWHERLKTEQAYTAVNMDSYCWLLGDLVHMATGIIELLGGIGKKFIFFLTSPLPFFVFQNNWPCSQFFFLSSGRPFLGKGFYGKCCFWGKNL